MPSYSNLGFKLIDTGTEQGTWGVTTNTNFQYLDTAIVGAATINLAGAGAPSNPTDLNVADFDASSGRNRIITFVDSGDLGAPAYVRITPDDFSGHYFIKNALTNNRPIIIFQGTYNGVTSYELPNGKDAILRCVGGGVNSTVYNVLDNLFTNAITTSSFTTPSFSTTNITANTITANTSFVGPGTGLTGTANQLSANFSNTTNNSTSTTNLAITADANTTSTVYPTIVSGSEGTLPFKVTPSKLSFVPSTGVISVSSVASTTFNVTNIQAGTVNTNIFSSSANVPQFTGTGAIDISSGTTAQRPTSPNTGMIRYNTTIAGYEVYAADGTWKTLAAGTLNPSLGIGQTWNQPTRVLGGTYPAPIRAIAVSINFRSTGAGSSAAPPTLNVIVGGATIASVTASSFVSTAPRIIYEQINFVVPAGATYGTSTPNGAIALQLWLELS